MNTIYFNNNELKNNMITINYWPKNIYTFDFFIEKSRQIVLKYIVDKIKNDDPILIYSLCRTTCVSILYVHELSKIINNKIILILFSPLLTLNNKIFLDKSGFGKMHSIHKIFSNFKNNKEYEEIVTQVFKNSLITKICYFSEFDKTYPREFNKNIYKISNNLKIFEFKKSKLHNFFSLFYYCYSKNFEKFRKRNHYLKEKDIRMVTSIWDSNLTIEELSKCIIKNNFDIFLKYKFIEMEKYN